MLRRLALWVLRKQIDDIRQQARVCGQCHAITRDPHDAGMELGLRLALDFLMEPRPRNLPEMFVQYDRQMRLRGGR
jgi:hypothetical protein